MFTPGFISSGHREMIRLYLSDLIITVIIRFFFASLYSDFVLQAQAKMIQKKT